MKKRYFFISYLTFMRGGFGAGNSHIVTDGHFPNRDYVAEEIIKQYKEDIDGLVIINIQELSEQDYRDFVADSRKSITKE